MTLILQRRHLLRVDTFRRHNIRVAVCIGAGHKLHHIRAITRSVALVAGGVDGTTWAVRRRVGR